MYEKLHHNERKESTAYHGLIHGHAFTDDTKYLFYFIVFENEKYNE